MYATSVQQPEGRHNKTSREKLTLHESRAANEDESFPLRVKRWRKSEEQSTPHKNGKRQRVWFRFSNLLSSLVVPTTRLAYTSAHSAAGLRCRVEEGVEVSHSGPDSPKRGAAVVRGVYPRLQRDPCLARVVQPSSTPAFVEKPKPGPSFSCISSASTRPGNWDSKRSIVSVQMVLPLACTPRGTQTAKNKTRLQSSVQAVSLLLSRNRTPLELLSPPAYLSFFLSPRGSGQ